VNSAAAGATRGFVVALLGEDGAETAAGGGAECCGF
jgi:hypothetical protein